VHWAGTEIAPRWAGFFDGAVRTGEDAGRAVIDLHRASSHAKGKLF
jgi:monoamine oxidase